MCCCPWIPVVINKNKASFTQNNRFTPTDHVVDRRDGPNSPICSRPGKLHFNEIKITKKVRTNRSSYYCLCNANADNVPNWIPARAVIVGSTQTVYQLFSGSFFLCTPGSAWGARNVNTGNCFIILLLTPLAAIYLGTRILWDAPEELQAPFMSVSGRSEQDWSEFRLVVAITLIIANIFKVFQLHSSMILLK